MQVILRKSILGYAFAAVLLTAASCKHDPDLTAMPDIPLPPSQTTGCDPDSVYFTNTVLPLLQSSCAMSGCHDAASAEHGIILTDYTHIYVTGHVRPGDANDTKIYEVLSESGEDRMPPPPANAFTADQKSLIAKWINQGALNNSCVELECDTANVTFAGTVMPIIQLNCTGCHGGASPNGGIRLTTFADVEDVASSGQLLGTISHAAAYQAMPPNSRLTDCQISQISKWITNGKPNN